MARNPSRGVQARGNETSTPRGEDPIRGLRSRTDRFHSLVLTELPQCLLDLPAMCPDRSLQIGDPERVASVGEHANDLLRQACNWIWNGTGRIAGGFQVLA